MRNLLQVYLKWQWLMGITIAISVLSCKEDSDSGNLNYDPNAPIVLKSFMPTNGPRATQVILEGSNFGTDREKVKVYFN